MFCLFVWTRLRDIWLFCLLIVVHWMIRIHLPVVCTLYSGLNFLDKEHISYALPITDTICRRLYHSLEWYTRVYITIDYGITYLFHDRRATTNTGLRTARSTGHAWSRFSGVGYGMLSHSRQCSCNGPFFSAKWMTPSMLMGMSLWMYILYVIDNPGMF